MYRFRNKVSRDLLGNQGWESRIILNGQVIYSNTHDGCNYLSMLVLRIIHVNKRDQASVLR